MSYNVHIIDDDPISQMLASKAVQMTNKVTSTSIFPNGREAINFLRANALNPTALPDIIFLDINMPVLDGWGFINEFAKLKLSFCKKITIYMLSSSIAEADINRAKETPEIYMYLIKPLKRNTILEIGATWDTLISTC
jgi:CheY-like chemotaxis protein